MKKNYFKKIKLICLSALLLFGSATYVNGQTVTLDAVLSGKITSADIKTDGAVTNMCSTCDRGYLKFDLTSIPVGATVISAKLKIVAITPSTSSGSNVNKITSTTLDAAIDSTGLYTAIDTGNTVWTGNWSFTAPLPVTYNLSLNAVGITNLNTSLTLGQMTLGIVRGSTNVYTFGGYNDTILTNIPQLEITYGFPCAGTPAAGAATAPANACSGINFDLVISENGLTGTTYQWQSSPDSVTFTDISGATSSTYALSQTSATYYYCIVTCTASGAADTSNVLQIGMNSFIDCHCIPPSTNCTQNDVITNVIFATINNTTTCSTNGYSYYATPNPTLYIGQTYPDSVTVGAGATGYVGVWIDYDHSGSYDTTEFTALGSGNGVQIVSSIAIPSTAMLGTTKMRVRVRRNTALTGNDACLGYNRGETEDYLVTIDTLLTCSGTPTIGVATAPASVCNGVNFNLSIPSTLLSGITYQWQSSPDGVAFTDIIGANTAIYSASQTAITYYQCIVTCTAGNVSDTSNVLTVGMNAVIDCHCTPPSTDCSLDDVITSVIFATINNTTTCSTNGYSYYATPNPILYLGYTYADSVTVGPGGTEYVAAWIDYDQSGTYDATEYTSFGSGNDIQLVASITIPLTATVGNTKMRVRVRYNADLTDADACLGYTYGETEDYLVNIQVSNGINETELTGVSVYPNPTTGILNVSISSASSNQLNLVINDIQGRTVYSYSDKNIGNAYKKEIDLRSLSKGIYFLKLDNGSQMNVQKIVVQ